jgi:hypothetical protein
MGKRMFGTDQSGLNLSKDETIFERVKNLEQKSKYGNKIKGAAF